MSALCACHRTIVDVILRSSIFCATCLSVAVVVLGHYTIDTSFMLVKSHVFEILGAILEDLWSNTIKKFKDSE